MTDNPHNTKGYAPLEGPYDIGVGYGLITLVEPHPGHELAYNRWYEQDHFFSGALMQPYLFSGRRWVATRDLQLLRYSDEAGATVLDPITRGCYLGTYWIVPDRIDDHMLFTRAANNRCAEDGRKFTERTLVFSEFQEWATSIYRSESVPRDIFALINPCPGLVLEVVDAPEPEGRDSLEKWLVEEHLPSRLRAPESPAELAMVFRTNPPRKHASHVAKDCSNGGRRLTILWFLTRDPRENWSSFFGPEGALVAAGGAGRLSLIAPFIPAKMGSDLYVDQLR